ncbi:MAG: DUF5990 family protein, partial [Arenicella sp.]
ELVDYVLSDGNDIIFIFSLRVKHSKNGSPNFLGEYAQGPVKGRFVYICSGEYAGQKGTQWARRAKVHLSDISWSQIEEAQFDPTKRLVAYFEATAKDGGPSCASVSLLGTGWEVSS